MNRLLSRFAAAALALIGVPAAAVTADVIPLPLHVVERPGPAVGIVSGTAVRFPAGDRDARDVAGYFTAVMARSGMVRTMVREGQAAPGEVAITIARGPVTGGREAYSVDVGAQGVKITAATRAGMLYGAVTTWQLLSANPGKPLKPLHIDDAPRFPWRGLMLDSARHFQSPAFIERMLDWMALHKLNTLQWHLTDDQGWRLEIKRYPRLTTVGGFRTGRDGAAYGGFYTQAEVRHLVAFAAARNITIVPEIEMPGHALAAIRAYPKLGFAGVDAAAQGDWGVFPTIYGVDDGTFTFLDNVLGEVMALFPSPVIAIGGDEAVKDQWHASPAVQARMHALGIADETGLQAYFVRRVGTFLNAHGRRLIGWDEILLGGGLPKSDTVLSWHGADGAVAAVKAGHDVVMATAPTLYLDNRQSTLPTEPPGRGTVVSLKNVYDYDPGDPPLPKGTAKVLLSAAERAHVLGLQANIWTEHIATDDRVERMALPRAAAVAESGWTAAERRDWAGFTARLPAQFARYRALGLNADEGAIGVAVHARRDGDTVRVRLSNQTGLGELRYTTDGGDPTAASPAAAGPLIVPIGTPVRAAAFVGGIRLSGITARTLDAASLRFRVSQELRPCGDRVVLNLEGRAAAAGPPPVYLVDIMNTCWIYPAAGLDAVTAISAGVGALPFNFQLGAELRTITLRPPATPEGELVVRLDTCDGPVIATMPLAGVRGDGTVTALTRPLMPVTGVHDLCLAFTARSPDPLRVLGWVRLDEAGR